jgi:hypothetical protein
MPNILAFHCHAASDAAFYCSFYHRMYSHYVYDTTTQSYAVYRRQ